jgi:hypothetical protein
MVRPEPSVEYGLVQPDCLKMTTIQELREFLAAGYGAGNGATPADAAASATSRRAAGAQWREGMIAGFVINGSGPRPSSSPRRDRRFRRSASTTASDPMLTLSACQTRRRRINDNWEQASNAAQIAASGFVPGMRSSRDHDELQPGAYTAIVSGANGTTGTGIVEVYEVDKPDMPLANISTRGKVSIDSDVMIAAS